jgi:hypothetical protein
MRFVKQVLRGDKEVSDVCVCQTSNFDHQLLLLTETTPIVVPQFEEFCMRKVWPQAKKSSKLMKFFPSYRRKRYPNREFFYTVTPDMSWLYSTIFQVFNSLYPGRMAELFREALVFRREQHLSQDFDRSVMILPKFAEMLERTPLFSSMVFGDPIIIVDFFTLARQKRCHTFWSPSWGIRCKKTASTKVADERDQLALTSFQFIYVMVECHMCINFINVLVHRISFNSMCIT